MKKYRIEIVPEAEEQIREYLAYILIVFRNKQAYEAVKEDYRNTLTRLSNIAGSIGEPDEDELRIRGLKKILFEKHNYVILYRTIEGDSPIARIVKIYHTSEDYLRKL